MHQYWKFLLLLLSCNFVFAGAKEDAKLIEKAKKVAAYNLKDPEAAKFRNLRVVTKPAKVDKTQINTHVCGELNAKNSYGAYTGHRKFMWSPDSENILLYDEKIDIPTINEAFNGVIDYVCD